MLTGLSVRNIVLIERLDLAFDGGLSVLTGETGAGKSILLDALGLSVGARADAGLVRNGAPQATVTAIFDVRPRHVARHACTLCDPCRTRTRTLNIDSLHIHTSIWW